MSDSLVPAAAVRSRTRAALILSRGLLMGVAGLVLLDCAFGLQVTGTAVTFTAPWARWVFMAAGWFLLIGAAGILARPVLAGETDWASYEGRLRNRGADRVWAAGTLAAGAVLQLLLFLGIAGVGIGFVGRELLLWLLAPPLYLAGAWGVFTSSESVIRSGRLKTGRGLRGNARIDSLRPTGARINYEPQVAFELTVTPEGREPYTARIKAVVPTIYASRAVRGASLPVLIDVDSPDHMLVLWHEA